MSQVMVVEKNSVDSFTPGVEIAVIRDMEGGLLLVCSASGKYDMMMIVTHNMGMMLIMILKMMMMMTMRMILMMILMMIMAPKTSVIKKYVRISTACLLCF